MFSEPNSRDTQGSTALWYVQGENISSSAIQQETLAVFRHYVDHLIVKFYPKICVLLWEFGKYTLSFFTNKLCVRSQFSDFLRTPSTDSQSFPVTLQSNVPVTDHTISTASIFSSLSIEGTSKRIHSFISKQSKP